MSRLVQPNKNAKVDQIITLYKIDLQKNTSKCTTFVNFEVDRLHQRKATLGAIPVTINRGYNSVKSQKLDNTRLKKSVA